MNQHPFVGAGRERYRMRRDWAVLPPGVEFGTTHSVAEDAEGRILVHHTGQDCMFIFSPTGSFLDSWGADFHAGAHGMVLSREGEGEFLYLAATKAGVMVKTTLAGEEVMRLSTPPRPDIYGNGQIYSPTETAVASTGDIYVTDGYGQSWVHRYTADGRYIDSFCGSDFEGGRLLNPHGIMIDTRGEDELVLVSDRGHSRLCYFTLEGESVRQVAGPLRSPCTTVQWGGRLYIPDLRSRLTILDRNDELVAHLGDWPDRWTEPGWPNFPRETWATDRFSSPHHLHVDRSGNIYVAEWLSDGTGDISKLVLDPE